MAGLGGQKGRAGKVIIPGVIDSTTTIIEHPETVAERIVRFANVARQVENVIAGVDCGFGTSVRPTRTDPKIVFAKLGSLAKGAEIATKEAMGPRSRCAHRQPTTSRACAMAGGLGSWVRVLVEHHHHASATKPMVDVYATWYDRHFDPEWQQTLLSPARRRTKAWGIRSRS